MSKDDTDDMYLSKCQYKVSEAISTYRPDFILYIAGYDVMKGDHYGKMNISDVGVMGRDEMVMKLAT